MPRLEAVVLAVKTDDLDVLHAWLNNGGSPVAPDGSVKGTTLLHWASFLGTARCADALLVAKADPNVTEADGKTPLHWAAFEGNVDLVEVLVGAGAALEPKDTLGHTPLDLARLQRQEDVMLLLEEWVSNDAAHQAVQEERKRSVVKRAAAAPALPAEETVPASDNSHADEAESGDAVQADVAAAAGKPDTPEDGHGGAKDTDAASTQESTTGATPEDKPHARAVDEAPVLFVPRSLSPADEPDPVVRQPSSTGSRSRHTSRGASVATGPADAASEAADLDRDAPPRAGPYRVGSDPWPQHTSSLDGSQTATENRSAAPRPVDLEEEVNGDSDDDDDLQSEAEARARAREQFLQRMRSGEQSSAEGGSVRSASDSAAPSSGALDRRDPGLRRTPSRGTASSDAPPAADISPNQLEAEAALDAARRNVERHDRHRHGAEFPAIDAALQRDREAEELRELRLLEREERRMARLERKVARKEERRRRRAQWLEQVMQLAAASHDIPREEYMALMEAVASAYAGVATSGSDRDRSSETGGYSRQSSSGMPRSEDYHNPEYGAQDEEFDGVPMVRAEVPRRQHEPVPLSRSLAEQPRDPSTLPQPHTGPAPPVPSLNIAHWRSQLAAHAARQRGDSRPATGRSAGAGGGGARSTSARSSAPSGTMSARGRVREPSTRYDPDLPLRIPLEEVPDRRPRSARPSARSRSAVSEHGDAEAWKPPASSRVEDVVAQANKMTLKKPGPGPGVSRKPNQIVPRS